MMVTDQALIAFWSTNDRPLTNRARMEAALAAVADEIRLKCPEAGAVAVAAWLSSARLERQNLRVEPEE